MIFTRSEMLAMSVEGGVFGYCPGLGMLLICLASLLQSMSELRSWRMSVIEYFELANAIVLSTFMPRAYGLGRIGVLVLVGF